MGEGRGLAPFEFAARLIVEPELRGSRANNDDSEGCVSVVLQEEGPVATTYVEMEPMVAAMAEGHPLPVRRSNRAHAMAKRSTKKKVGRNIRKWLAGTVGACMARRTSFVARTATQKAPKRKESTRGNMAMKSRIQSSAGARWRGVDKLSAQAGRESWQSRGIGSEGGTLVRGLVTRRLGPGLFELSRP